MIKLTCTETVSHIFEIFATLGASWFILPSNIPRAEQLMCISLQPLVSQAEGHETGRRSQTEFNQKKQKKTFVLIHSQF